MTSTRRRSIHRRLTWALQAVLGLGLVVAVVRLHWLDAAVIAAILLLTFAPSVLGRRFRVEIPPEFELLAIGFLFASLFLGEVLDYYQKYWWWDVLLHAGSGFLLGILGFLLVHVLNEAEDVALDMRPSFVAFFSFCFAMAAGGLWEIFEYAMDSLFGMNMQKSGLVDTMWDLIVDAVGALVISILGYGWIKTTDKSSFLERWIERFITANPRLFARRPRSRT